MKKQKTLQNDDQPMKKQKTFFIFFDRSTLSVLRGHSFFSSPPQRPMTSDFEGFSIPDFIHYILFTYLNSWERASIFPFECSVLNKGTTGSILIKSLVWRGPWLGIEPGTSRTRPNNKTNKIRYVLLISCFVPCFRLADNYEVSKCSKSSLPLYRLCHLK